jgi:hypothetical protein
MKFNQVLMPTNAAAQLFIRHTTASFCTQPPYKLTNTKFWEKFVNHKYIYILCRFGFEKLMEFHVTFFHSSYIWLIQTKSVLIDNRPTEFHQGHSAVLEMKHANRWILYAHYTFFSWTSRVHDSEIMYKIQVIQN